MDNEESLELADELDNIATELHGLGDTIMFLSQSEMNSSCGESLGFLEGARGR